jgi:hypothetical protein
MDSHDSAASVYSEAKGEYTKQLTLFIVPVFHRFFMGCLTQAAQEEPQAKRQLWKFQELLSQVPEWNMDKVQRETNKLIGEIQCDYLEELVTAVFIAHTKVLTAIRIGNKNKRVQITIPKLDHFLHRALCECSRLLWSSAYLFHNELSPIEKQKNHRQIEQMLHEGIAQAIRGLLPVKNILKDYLAEPEADTDADDEEEEDDKDKDKEKEKEKVVVEDVETSVEKAEEKPVEPEIPPIVQEELPAVSEPVEEVASVPVIKLEEPPAPVLSIPEAPAQPVQSIPEPPAQPVQPTPTIVIETEPSVRFTDFNQVIQPRNGETQIGYVHTTHEAPPEDVEFMDEEGEPISEFEVITEGPAAALGDDDFETLP